MVAKRKTGTARRPRAKRPPGRPGGAEHTQAVREALLQAARGLFAQRDFRAVSVRELAAAAGVNPALVNYHFGDKRGLYRAMLERTLGPVFERAQALAGAGEEAGARGFVRAVMRLLADEPWVPRLIVREVLAEEGIFREAFMREFAPRGAGRLPAILARERARGSVRTDLDVTFAALSLTGMVLFPFLAQPIAERVFGLRIDRAVAERLAEHTARLFYEGAGPGSNRRRGGGA